VRKCGSEELPHVGLEAAATTAESPTNCVGLQRRTAACVRHIPVGEGRHRVVPAANSFALGRPHGGLRERLKPPQQQRKAPQTAWGFNGEPRAACGTHPSAKADIALSQPRIHSPRDRLGTPANGSAGCATEGTRWPAEGSRARDDACCEADCGSDGKPRRPLVTFQPRFQPPGQGPATWDDDDAADDLRGLWWSHGARVCAGPCAPRQEHACTVGRGRTGDRHAGRAPDDRPSADRHPRIPMHGVRVAQALRGRRGRTVARS
jgi:hypothetical protein